MKHQNTEGYAPYSFQPRDRAREKARVEIKHRVDHRVPVVHSTCRHADDQILDLLDKTVQNNRSFFSLNNLAKSVTLFSDPIPAHFMWSLADPDELKGQEKLVSWHGYEFRDLVKKYLKELATVTPLEYAVLFERYHIVGSLIVGGINPALHGSILGETVGRDWEEELRQEGCNALQKFFDGVPLSLSGYVVKRLFDLRFTYWQKEMKDNGCDLCKRSDVPRSMRLAFDAPTTCHHTFCEPCIWRCTLKRLDQTEDDVVLCPKCWPMKKSERDESSSFANSPSALECRQQRFETSKAKYYQLPKGRDELKQLGRKGPLQKTKNGRFALTSTWMEAVKPLLGSSQEIRLERFFGFAETSAFHRLKACLSAGIDLSLTNHYGQTGLYTAAWYGHEAIVLALLEAGADPNTLANDGTSALDAALLVGFDAVVTLLRKYGARPSSCRMKPLDVPVDNVTGKELIPRLLDHPGAGSYTINGILDESSVLSLTDFWKTLPIAESKVKSGPCSERRYFCDTTGVVTSILSNAVRAINSQLDGVIFLPFMRFLCYLERGISLAPHRDLSRVDVETGKTSTHTFILYLTDCASGGATSLLRGLAGNDRNEKLAVVRPVRGRLLLFPHACPHEGEAVVDVPKLLIRGEAILPEDIAFLS